MTGMAAKLLSAAGNLPLFRQQPRDWRKLPAEYVTMYKWMLERYFQVYCRPQGKVMFSQAPVILFTIDLIATRSLLILVTVRLVHILLECFLVKIVFGLQFDDIVNSNFFVITYIDMKDPTGRSSHFTTYFSATRS